MKRLSDIATRVTRRVSLLALCALLVPAVAGAQGVTSGTMSGVVTNAQGQPVPGASVIAIHEPSGTAYETTSRADGRFSIPAMRVGAPYSVTVNFVGTGGTAFEPVTIQGLSVTLGTGTDVPVQVKTVNIQESVTVTANAPDAVFSSSRTGAATASVRSEIATLPTISARITDITRLSPQASGNGSFAGQDNRLNNITVDGSYFNNSFGLGAQPGDRTGVAPISLESIEQIQVSVAPYDVRQGSFVGAAVNTVTRSGTNSLVGSFYHRYRNDSMTGTEAAGNAVSVGTFTFRNTGVWAGGPIVKNKLFVFGNYENEKETRPLTTFRANAGGEAVGGSVTRVRASDLTALSSFLSTNFGYDPGTFDGLDDLTPAKRYLFRTDYNLAKNHKVSFRYNQLDSSSASITSGSSSAGIGRPTFTTNWLGYSGSTYTVLENIKSGIGEWNSIWGSSVSNNLIIGMTSNDESRGDVGKLFPFVDILDAGNAYTSFGTEPFSVQNELRYKTFQLQDTVSKFTQKHTFSAGVSAQRYQSDNVFWSCCPQGNYTYNSLEDFYTDARGYLANPNRTTSPVTARLFKVRYSNVPNLDKPLQPLKVWYTGGYAQDEFRPASNLTVTLGVRADASIFTNTAYENARADALTFRDPAGRPIQFKTGEMPSTKVLWSPRTALNWDVAGRQTTQVRVGTGLFTGAPLYVWVSNQLGNTGVLIGEIAAANTTAFPFNPNPDAYKPTDVTGAGATSFQMNVTDPDFKFPQVWRTNAAVDHRLPGGFIATVEYIYNKDVNGVSYYDANLPAAQSAFTGVDARPRYTSNRINNTPGNVITNAFVLTNQSIGSSWNLATSVSRTPWKGLSFRAAYAYGDSNSTFDPGSTAFSSYANNQHSSDPNNPGAGRSAYASGNRLFFQGSMSRQYFGFGSTTISAFWELKPSRPAFSQTASYTFAGDMNGDGYSGNDLIYIPKDQSEMNFLPFTSGGVTFSAAQQAEAFEAFIKQDSYLNAHRGEYATRGGVTYPLFNRMDLSVVQDVFKNIGGKRNAGQFRLDVTNFLNLLNSDWGVAWRPVAARTGADSITILTNATADPTGRVGYRMATAGGQLVTKSWQRDASLNDVYQLMLSFRYSFN